MSFSDCLPFILKEEGGNDDDPHDPGGRTSRGIIQTEYDAWRKAHGEPTQDVWKASDAEVSAVYEQQYWEPWCPKLPPGVDLVFFDMAVNSGPHRATVMLQQALGVNPDGHIGLITLGAVQSMNPIKLVTNFSERRVAFYRGLNTFKYFGKGWLARTSRIEAAALKMAVEKSNGIPVRQAVDSTDTGSNPTP